jgi:NAD(P)-dependent dehydrogenase (short-subunit alcohol dehydrogenase family)
MERFHRFVNRSLELVSVPMSVFLPSLEKRSGWNVIVSTESVRTAPPQWPHYFTAKCAVEGLAHWAAPQFKSTKFLVIRPPKLLTDQMNTPSGRQGATTVEIIAATLAKRLAGSVSGPLVEILETFGSDFSSAGDDSSYLACSDGWLESGDLSRRTKHVSRRMPVQWKPIR